MVVASYVAGRYIKGSGDAVGCPPRAVAVSPFLALTLDPASLCLLASRQTHRLLGHPHAVPPWMQRSDPQKLDANNRGNMMARIQARRPACASQPSLRSTASASLFPPLFPHFHISFILPPLPRSPWPSQHVPSFRCACSGPQSALPTPWFALGTACPPAPSSVLFLATRQSLPESSRLAAVRREAPEGPRPQPPRQLT
mmetsp:Transcript_41568/g.98532  ORF Transcript_41568/g.98532 Transcript_41568/m.98532 type:complete len:199 (+) Transcript_41568:787-1383(+)